MKKRRKLTEEEVRDYDKEERGMRKKRELTKKR